MLVVFLGNYKSDFDGIRYRFQASLLTFIISFERPTFSRVLYTPAHVLKPLLPNHTQHDYNLRDRSQNFELINKARILTTVIFDRPYFVRSSLCHSVSSVCRRLSVTFCIVAKRYVLAKNRLKEQIRLPPPSPEINPWYHFGPPFLPKGDYPI